MQVMTHWANNKWNLLKSSRQVQLGALLICACAITGTALVGGMAIKNQKHSVTPSPTPWVQEASDSGVVAGVAIVNTPTPTPTPAKKVRTVSPSPTPSQNTTNGNSQSSPKNNNQSSNTNSSSNNTNQSQSNASNLTPTEVVTPSPTPQATSSSTSRPTPTPDNTPFEASMAVTWTGEQVMAVVTANKPLKKCFFEIWGTGITGSGDKYVNGESNSCSINGASGSGWSETTNNVWSRVEAMSGETKELGEKQPCDPNSNAGCS